MSAAISSSAAKAAEEQDRAFHPVERDDGVQDAPTVAEGRKLGMRSFGTREVARLDFADGHAELERVDAHLRLDLEALRQDREALHEPPRKGAIAGKNVREATSEQSGQQPREKLVPQDVAAPVGVGLAVLPCPDNHVQIF